MQTPSHREKADTRYVCGERVRWKREGQLKQEWEGGRLRGPLLQRRELRRDVPNVLQKWFSSFARLMSY